MSSCVHLRAEARTVRLVACAALGLCLLPASAMAQTSTAKAVAVGVGGRTILTTEPCIVVIEPKTDPNAGQDAARVEIARVADAREHAIFIAPRTASSTPVRVILDVGSTAATTDTAGNKICGQPLTRQPFDVTVSNATQEIPPGALDQSFRVLMTAFVLAILLENAFALIFNWRLFLEFFVGKAWRTPIMLAGALIVVSNFDLDLMSRLFYAYNPTAEPQKPASVWFTRLITAMILAGGSAGVNRVLVALGFRSQLKPEAELPQLEETEAFVAIQVRARKDKSDFQVNMDEVNPLPADTPRIIGFVGKANNVWTRIIELLFPIRTRVPRSGGLRVRAGQAYRISLTDLSDGKHYNTHGMPIDTPARSEVFTFAPKAIIDFVITVPRQT